MEDLPLAKILPNAVKAFNKKDFTPLEKSTDKVSGRIPNISNSGLVRLSTQTVRKRNSLTGFTLTEVVVATLLLAVLAAGVAGAFWSSQHFLNRARHRVQAFNFAMEALDRLRSNYNYLHEEMSVGSGHLASGIECSIAGEMEAMAPLAADFTYDVTEPQVNGYKQVTIKVNWNEPSLKD